jgi:FkbM family methyltransferase
MSAATSAPAFAPLALQLRTACGESDIAFEFDLDSPVQRGMHQTLAQGAFYEAETTLFLLSVLRPGDRFVDVGGHVGYFSIIASRAVGPSGRVVTFEPAPENYSRLIHHLALNACSNVIPLHLAASADPRAVTLHLNSDNDGGHALWDVRMHQLNERSRLHPRTHDAWAVRVADAVGPQPVRAMKLDVEGAEFEALRGAEPLLAGDAGVPFVVAEINRGGLQALGASEEALRAWMHDLGYDTWLMRVEAPQLTRLEPGASLASDHVFNVLFWKRGVALP